LFDSIKSKFQRVTEKVASTASEEDKVGKLDRARAYVSGYAVLDWGKLEEVLSDFEMALLESDVAFDVVERIIEDLKSELYGRKLKKGEIGSGVREALRKSLSRVVREPQKSLEEMIEESEKPFVISFVGINGTGKTTTIAKVAHRLKNQGYSTVISASDTFRAAAIEQLEAHAQSLGVKMIKHARGADAAAVAFDALKHARARGKDVVLIDTAGRMETNVNLMDEMKKISRTVEPSLTLFVGEALTGNAAVEQAEKFDQAVGIDGVILTKADADVKGGTALSITYSTGKPIFYLGVGQDYGDLKPFAAKEFIEDLLKE